MPGVDAPVPVAFCCRVLERLESLLTLAYIGRAWLAPGGGRCEVPTSGFSYSALVWFLIGDKYFINKVILSTALIQ